MIPLIFSQLGRSLFSITERRRKGKDNVEDESNRKKVEPPRGAHSQTDDAERLRGGRKGFVNCEMQKKRKAKKTPVPDISDFYKRMDIQSSGGGKFSKPSRFVTKSVLRLSSTPLVFIEISSDHTACKKVDNRNRKVRECVVK